MRTSENIDKISVAIVKYQSLIDGVVKGAENPFFKSKYANLSDIIRAIKPSMVECKLAILQSGGELAENAITVVTRVIHESGQWIETNTQVPIVKRDPQAVGSAISYGKRYDLQAISLLPTFDDDGELAMEREKKQTKGDLKPTKIKSSTDKWTTLCPNHGITKAELSNFVKKAKKGDKLIHPTGDLKTIDPKLEEHITKNIASIAKTIIEANK